MANDILKACPLSSTSTYFFLNKIPYYVLRKEKWSSVYELGTHSISTEMLKLCQNAILILWADKDRVNLMWIQNGEHKSSGDEPMPEQELK